MVLTCLIVMAAGRMACAPHKGLVPTESPAGQYGAVLVPSPNWNVRPAGTVVSAIVLHATVTDSGQEAVNTFLDPASRRSSHFVVDRDGSITEMVPPERRAWHAGASVLDGVPDVNNFSVGIEMVNRNDGEPYSDAQYAAVARLIRRLRTRYHIQDERIVSHAWVALPPGRKTDPVGFDFARLYAALRD